jgi:hypothetical protein
MLFGYCRILLVLSIFIFQSVVQAGDVADCYKLYPNIDDKLKCFKERAAVDESNLRLASASPGEFAEAAKRDILRWETKANASLYEFHSLTLDEDKSERALCGSLSRADSAQSTRFIKIFDKENWSFRSTYFPIDNPQTELERFKSGLFEKSWTARCANSKLISE